jgi:hypothetical protein
VNKNFQNVTYAHTFQSFEFADSGVERPHNSGYGTNLQVTKSVISETIPILGSQTPIEITQDALPGTTAATEIFVTKLYSNAQTYGIIFAIQDFNKNALKSVSLIAENGTLVGSSAPIKHLGAVVNYGKTYDYYLVRVSAGASDNANAKFTFGVGYYSNKLPEGKMKLNVYGGFIFEQLSFNQYNEANLTDKLHFPYHKDYERQKVRGVMEGNTLLAGFEQSDGTILANDNLKIAEANILTSAQLHMAKLTLRYIENTFSTTTMATLYYTSPSQSTGSSGWCHAKEPVAGYPTPVYPIIGGDPLRITVLTHVFDTDNTISADFEVEFRLTLYRNGTITTTTESLGTIKYKDKKQTSGTTSYGKKYLLNHMFLYTIPTAVGFQGPPIAYSLQFKQIKPAAEIGNESVLTFNAVQIPDLSGIQ